MSKIAIIGSSGYIAKFLIEQLLRTDNFNEIIKIDKTSKDDVFYLDLLEPEKFDYNILNDVEFVIFTAAISSPDKCAEEFKLCWNINVIGTKYFIREALKRNCHVIFFSSDAVYGDIQSKRYDENSETKAHTSYGIMKKSIEDEFKNHNLFKSLRLSYVVSAKDKFVSYCLECIKENKVAEVFHPFYRNCIMLNDVFNAIIWIIQNWDLYQPFVLNVTGNELISRIQIADEINRVFSNRLIYKIVKPDEDFYKNRSQITQMISLYLKKYNILEQKTFSEKIQRELENIKL